MPAFPPGESKLDFLEMLARQRGITLGTDKEGNMTARDAWIGGGDMLIEGINILEGREVMTIKGGGGPNDSISQHGGSDDRLGHRCFAWYRREAHNRMSRPAARAFMRRTGSPAEHPGKKEDAKMRSKFESQQRGAEQLQVTIVVQGWLKPSGGLWTPGEKVHVKSPDADRR